MKEVRIGLVGAGWMGKAHTNSFANALMLFGPEFGKPVFEVVADVNVEAAKLACEKNERILNNNSNTGSYQPSNYYFRL